MPIRQTLGSLIGGENTRAGERGVTASRPRPSKLPRRHSRSLIAAPAETLVTRNIGMLPGKQAIPTVGRVPYTKHPGAKRSPQPVELQPRRGSTVRG